jgi:predicted PurR-regulated permease PerM
MTKKRPFGVTILAILAGIAAILAVIHFLQAIGLIPYMIGPIAVRGFNLWNALMWGLMIWVWTWLVKMLWDVDPQAWMFLAVISVFNLILNFVLMLGANTSFSDVSLSTIVNVLILAYVMLPSTRRAFGTDHMGQSNSDSARARTWRRWGEANNAFLPGAFFVYNGCAPVSKPSFRTRESHMSEQAKLPIYLVVALASIFIIMLGIKSTAAIINPILLALVITIAVSPLPQKLIKRGMSGKLALVLTILAVVGAIMVVLVLVAGSVYALRLKIPTYAENIATRSEELSSLMAFSNSISEGLAQLDPADVSALAGRLLGWVASTLVQIFMTLLIFVFMLSAAISIPGRSQDDLESETSLIETVRAFTSDVSQYVTVTTIINFLVGLGDAIFLMILGVDFALLWGLLAWFLGYIPTVGFWLALIPPTILAWAEHGMTTAAIVFLGFVLINGSVQNFIQPKMMGDNLNISPVIVFLSLFVWGWLLGAIGAILAVPMTLMVLVVLERFESTRGFIRLIRTGGAGDEEDARKAREELGSFLSRFKATVGLGSRSGKAAADAEVEAAGEAPPPD